MLTVKISIFRGKNKLVELQGNALRPLKWEAATALHALIEDVNCRKALEKFKYIPNDSDDDVIEWVEYA